MQQLVDHNRPQGSAGIADTNQKQAAEQAIIQCAQFHFPTLQRQDSKSPQFHVHVPNPQFTTLHFFTSLVFTLFVTVDTIIKEEKKV